MKKATLQAIYDMLPDGDIKEEVRVELNRGAEKAEANRKLYESVKPIVLEALPVKTPVTVAELYEEIKGKLPANFGRGKVSWGLQNDWRADIVIHEGRPSSYTKVA